HFRHRRNLTNTTQPGVKTVSRTVAATRQTRIIRLRRSPTRRRQTPSSHSHRCGTRKHHNSAYHNSAKDNSDHPHRGGRPLSDDLVTTQADALICRSEGGPKVLGNRSWTGSDRKSTRLNSSH